MYILKTNKDNKYKHKINFLTLQPTPINMAGRQK